MWHVVYHLEKTCCYIHDLCITLTIDFKVDHGEYVVGMGIHIMNFIHSLYLVPDFNDLFMTQENGYIPKISFTITHI